MAQIILASASPRRSELLRQAGMDFIVIPSIGEEVITSTHPAQVVEELSAQKAREVADRIIGGREEKAADFDLVIGADTVVAADHKILGKPADREDARKMIEMLQGNVHQVYTGVTLIVKDAKGNIHTKETPTPGHSMNVRMWMSVRCRMKRSKSIFPQKSPTIRPALMGSREVSESISAESGAAITTLWAFRSRGFAVN